MHNGCMADRSSLTSFVLHHGRVFQNNGAWAEAVAVHAGRFLAVGSEAEARAALAQATGVAAGSVAAIDLRGGTLIPGFVDGHMHPLWGAVYQESGIQLINGEGAFLDRAGAVADAVQQWIANHHGDGWVAGYGWNPSLAKEPGFDRHLLDRVAGERPVYLLSLDAHFALVNSAGLERLGAIQFPPDSGLIPEASGGGPSGLLLETPQFIATMRVVGQLEYDWKAAAFAGFQQRALACGITAINDVVTDLDALTFYGRLLQEERLHLRMVCSPYGPLGMRERMQAWLEENRIPADRLALGPVKYLLDGTPGNHNAAWFQPYTDDPSTSGFLTIAPDALTDVVRDAEHRGYDLALHAAGDLSVHASLDAIEFGTEEGQPHRRHRVEHFDNMTSNDRRRLTRLAARGLIASVQPTHFAEVYLATIRRVIGEERLQREYPLKVFLDAGVPLAINTDWPAALTFAPLENLQLAEEHGDESLTPQQALLAATAGNAYAMRRETELGAIAAGYYADAVLLDGDPTEAHPERLKVLATWVGGTLVAGAVE